MKKMDAEEVRRQWSYSKDPGPERRTTEEWWQIRDEAYEEFDRWLDQVKDEARREALRSAASEVRREARWQEEQLALHESRSSIVRLLMLEQIFIEWSKQEEA